MNINTKFEEIDELLSLKIGTSKKILGLILKRQKHLLTYNNPMEYDYYHSSLEIEIDFRPEVLSIEDFTFDAYNFQPTIELIRNEIELFQILNSI
jgi:hypothetical protein